MRSSRAREKTAGLYSAGMFVMIGPTLVQHQHSSVNTIPIRYQCILAAHRQLDTIIRHNLSDALNISMRVTRARAQQGNDDATDATERAPLNQISSNASPKQTRHDDEELVPKTPAKTPAKTPGRKAKGKGRAKKGKKGKAAEEDEEEQTGAAPEEEQAADEAPTNEPTGDDVSKDASDGEFAAAPDQQPWTNGVQEPQKPPQSPSDP